MLDTERTVAKSTAFKDFEVSAFPVAIKERPFKT